MGRCIQRGVHNARIGCTLNNPSRAAYVVRLSLQSAIHDMRLKFGAQFPPLRRTLKKSHRLRHTQFCPPREEPPPKDFQSVGRSTCVLETPSNPGSHSHSNPKQSLYHESIHKLFFLPATVLQSEHITASKLMYGWKHRGISVIISNIYHRRSKPSSTPYAQA